MSDETPTDEAAQTPPASTAPADSSAATLPAKVEPSAGETPSRLTPTTPTVLPPRPAGPIIEFAMPAQRRPFAIPKYAGCLVKLTFGFGVLILMGYFALIALSPKARQWATSKEGPTPFAAVNQVLAIPAQAIGKTKDVVAASDARTNDLNGVVADEEAKVRPRHVVVDPFVNAPTTIGRAATGPASAASTGKADDQSVSRAAMIAMAEKLASEPDKSRATNAGQSGTSPITNPVPVASAPPKEPDAPAQLNLQGGIVISSASPVVRAAFFYWVVNLNISGVFQSPPHRIMVNNRLVYAGQELNASLGITFDHLETANKLIVFRDRTGAFVTRSY